MTADKLRLLVIETLYDQKIPPKVIHHIMRVMSDALKSHTGGTGL